MKLVAMLVAAMLAFGFVAAYTLAQEGDAPREPKAGKEKKEGERKDGERKEGDKKAGLQGEMAKMAEVCGLTEEQQKRIVELQQARDKEMRELMVKYQSQMFDVLTPEQRAAWNQSQIMQMVQRFYQKANLTEDQLTKIKAKATEAAQGVVLGDEKSRGEAMRKVTDYIGKEVLTDEQKASMKDGRKEGEGKKEGDGKKEGQGKKDGESTKAGPAPQPLPPITD